MLGSLAVDCFAFVLASPAVVADRLCCSPCCLTFVSFLSIVNRSGFFAGNLNFTPFFSSTDFSRRQIFSHRRFVLDVGVLSAGGILKPSGCLGGNRLFLVCLGLFGGEFSRGYPRLALLVESIWAFGRRGVFSR